MHVVDTTIARSGSLPAVPGQQSGYVPGVMQAEAELLAALAPHESLIETWLQCGGYQSAPASGKITEIDSADGKLWTADNISLARVSNPLVMGGRKRWETFSNAQEGFRGTAGSPPSGWTGYSIILPDYEPKSFAANNNIFAIGSGVAARLNMYVDTSARVRITHGSGGNTPNFNGATLVAGTRYSIMLTQVNGGGAVALYVNGTTPVSSDTSTITLAPPNATAGGILGTADDSIRSEAKMSQIIVVREAITNTATIAAIMAACEKIRTFVPSV